MRNRRLFDTFGLSTIPRRRHALVVGADGRNSRLTDWLTALGYETPPETVVNSFQGYASRRYRPAAGFKADWQER
jgi:hypothetical protein